MAWVEIRNSETHRGTPALSHPYATHVRCFLGRPYDMRRVVMSSESLSGSHTFFHFADGPPPLFQLDHI